MIAFTKRSGKEIGFELGFEDSSHFSKFFKTNTGHPFHEFKDTIIQ
jgi:AraC family transcriptional activator of pobA